MDNADNLVNNSCNSSHLLMGNIYFKTSLNENLFNLLRDN